MRSFKLVLCLISFFVVITAFAQEWQLPLTLYIHPDTTKQLVLKTSNYGTEMYDPPVIIGSDTIAVDVPLPPAPPSGFYAYFPLNDPSFPYINRLSTDARSSTSDTIIWTVWWAGTGFTDSVTIAWNPASVPGHGRLLINRAIVGSPADWSTASDMSSLNRFKAQGVMNWVQIRFTRGGLDTAPPYYANWRPPDGAVDVPETTSSLCVDVLDYMSGVNPASITLSVRGITIPTAFLSITPITGGFRVCANTGGMITLPPGEVITSIICASDMAGNRSCDTASFTVADTGAVFYCVSGRVTLEGETDFAGTIVQMGAYLDTTDATGFYRICAPAGSYRIRVWHDGFNMDSLDISLYSDQVHNFHLSISRASVRGRVILDGEMDHSGSTVLEVYSGISAITNALGNYNLSGIPLGPVRITASHPGFIDNTVNFTLTRDTTNVNFILFRVPSFYNVSGRITLEGTTDHSATNVAINGIGYAETTVTSATGAFNFIDVPEGGYNLRAWHTGYVTFDTTFTLLGGDVTINRMLHLAPLVTLNPPSNVQASTRPCWPGAFNLITFDPPMKADTVKLAHCSGRGYGDVTWGAFGIYYGYGSVGGGYAMPFVAPRPGMTLSKVRMRVHPLSYGKNTKIYVWAESDTGGPGAVLTSLTTTVSDTHDGGWAYFDITDITVGTSVFFVGWQDRTLNHTMYVLYEYYSPDTLAWQLNAWDSSFTWLGDNVEMQDGDFAIECYVSGGSRSSEEEEILLTPSDRLARTKIRRPGDMQKQIANRHKPLMLTLPTTDPRTITASSEHRERPMETPIRYRLFRSTSPFTDTLFATFHDTVSIRAEYYLDTRGVNGIIYYYGMVAVYPSGNSRLSNVVKGYTANPPAGTDVLLVDWGGGHVIEDDLGWRWDPSDTMRQLLNSVGYSGSRVLVTPEHERLYGYSLADDDDPLFDLIIITWNPLAGWLGPRMRQPEWKKLRDYLLKGGKLFIEGADAVEVLSGDGYTTNPYDSLYSLFGIQYRNAGRAGLDTGNVRFVYGASPVFSPADTFDYNMRTIADYDVDEFEHAMGSGASTVLRSQMISPMPRSSNGRAVWMNNIIDGFQVYIQSVYLASIIDGPGATNEIMMGKIMRAFGMVGIEEKPVSLPGEMTLYPNAPNPFNPITVIAFKLEKTATIELSIYDIMGNKVSTLFSGTVGAGIHRAVWNGMDDRNNPMPSGVYLYKLSSSAGSLTRKMMLVK